MGLYGQQNVWQCKHCNFRGKMFGDKKPFSTDPKIYEDEGTGVRYRWMFLAKCHTKVGSGQKEGDVGYGCLICSLGNMPSGVYGSSATLFRHVVDEHAQSMSEAMAVRAWCVLGRTANAREDFDLNIP